MNESLQEDFEDVAVWLRSLHGIVLFVLLIGGVSANGFLLVLVSTHKNLQYRSVLSSLGLVFADLIIAMTWSTQSLANIIAGSCPFGELGCSILGALTTIGIYARWCTIALITLERFCKIVWPFGYTRWSKPLLISLSITSWAVPALTILPRIAGLGRFKFRLDYSACIITCNSEEPCFQFYIVLYGCFFIIGSVIPMILYFMLCILGHHKAYKLKHITLGTFKASLDNITEDWNTPTPVQNDQPTNITTPPDDYTSGNVPSSPSSTSSSWGGALEKKILITFFMIFVNVFITQLPIYVTSALRSSEEIYSKIPLIVHFLGVHIYLLGPVLDPLLIMRNKDFRDVIMKMWRRRKAQRSQQNSVSTTLMEFAKIGGLFDMQLTGKRNLRRNSCPSSTLNHIAFMEKKLTKASSLDRGCASITEENGEPRRNSGHIGLKIEEEDTHQLRREDSRSEQTLEADKVMVLMKNDILCQPSISLECTVTALWPARTYSLTS